MLLQNKSKNPRVIMSIGMVFLILALLWPRYVHLFSGHMSEASIDGWRGFLFGVSIGTNLWAVKLLSQRRRQSGS
jgi:hypothetical protein